MPYTKIGEKRGVPIDLYYETHGNGRHKVLFIMGFLTSHHAWEPQIKFFADKEDFQICVFDNRGCGATTVSTYGYSSSQLAQDALELCDYLNWSKFHIVAISMGGMIAIELSLHNLDRVVSLSLGVTHCGGLSSLTPVVGIWKMLRSIVNIKTSDRAKAAQSMLYSQEFLEKLDGEGESAKPMLEKLASEWASLHVTNPSPIAFLGHLKTVLTHSVSFERLKTLKAADIPILIMTGTNDDLVPPVNSHTLHNFLEVSEFVVFEGAGHCVNLECEEKFNEAMFKNIQRGIEKAGTSKNAT